MNKRESQDEMKRMLIEEGLISEDDLSCEPDSLESESEDLEQDRFEEMYFDRSKESE